MSDLISAREAHDAMASYLNAVYGQSDGIFSEDIELLAMQIRNLNCWDEWEHCIRSESGAIRVDLSDREAFDAMRAFVKLHVNSALSNAYEQILSDTQYDAVDATGAPISNLWPVWLDALHQERT